VTLAAHPGSVSRFRQAVTGAAAVMLALVPLAASGCSMLVIRIGQPYRPHSGRPGQWTAIIYTKKMLFGPAHVPLLTCLHRSRRSCRLHGPD
jgi:hypothetical protein